jgi:hypothetical protein
VVSRAVSGLLVALAVGAAGWLAIRYGLFNTARIGADEMDLHSDWQTFHASAVALVEGRSIYATGASLPNLNPPVLTVVLAPFAALDALPAYRLWTLLTLAVVVGCVLVVARELRLPAGRAGLAVAAVLLGAPLQATLGLGQIYGLLTAALTAAWLAGRRGRPVLGAVAVGVAVALKPTLAPVLLVPAVRREWRAAVAGAVTTAALTALGAAVAGPAATAEWVRLLLAQPISTFFDNASLPATLVRLTSATEWGTPVVEVPGGYAAGLVLGLLAVVVTLWRARGELALWAVAAAALLASPVTWNTYLVVLVPGVVVLLARAPRVAAPLLALPLVGQEWPALWYGDDGTASAVPLSLYCAVLLAHWVALALAAARSDRGPDTPADPVAAGAGRTAGPGGAAGVPGPRDAVDPGDGTATGADRQRAASPSRP